MREVNINNNKGAVMDKPQIKYIDDKPPTLEEMQEYVGGYIQVVNAHNGDQIIMDEEGKMKSKSINYKATKHWIGENANAYDYVVGDAMILSGKARLS